MAEEPQDKKPELGKDKKHPDEKDKKPQPKPQEPIIPTALTLQIDELMRRLRLLEERYSGLRKKTQFTEQNMLKDAKELFSEIKVLHETITELKSELSELNEKLTKLNQEVNQAVKKTDFNVLAKYIEFWQPLNYITKEEAEKLIRETNQKEAE